MRVVPANPVLADSLDTYYQYVAGQYAKINPARQLLGMVNAQDWPQAELVDGALYCLYLNSVEIPEQGTRAQQYFEHYLQWAWVFLGNDLQSTQVGLNRGSRYRSDLAVIEELRQAHFPGFCPKQQTTFDPVAGTPTVTAYSPVETITWSTPKLGTKLAMAQSGISYGTAPLEVYAWSTVNPIVNG